MEAIGTKPNNYSVAVTGGIGSGKTAVCNALRDLGQFVVSCDEIYAELLNDVSFMATLNENFNGVLDLNGKLDKRKLASVVFSDEEQLNKLNRLTHGTIMARVKQLCKDKPLTFCEVPLLFENGYEKLFDAVIVVLRNKEERIQYVMQRSGSSREEVMARINAQYNYDGCSFPNYYVIKNSGGLNQLKNRTEEIFNDIRKKTR